MITTTVKGLKGVMLDANGKIIGRVTCGSITYTNAEVRDKAKKRQRKTRKAKP